MLIIPSIGWLYPIGRQRQRGDAGGPYVGAGVGLGFPFVSAENDDDSGIRQAANGARRRRRSRSQPRARRRPRAWPRKSKRKSWFWGREKPEITAAGVMMAPFFLLGILGAAGYKAGRETSKAGAKMVCGAIYGLGYIGKRIGRTGKWYGNHVKSRGMAKPFTGGARPASALEGNGAIQQPSSGFGNFRPTISQQRPALESGKTMAGFSACWPSAGGMM